MSERKVKQLYLTELLKNPTELYNASFLVSKFDKIDIYSSKRNIFCFIKKPKLIIYEQEPRNNICRTLWDNSRPECHFGKEIFERQNLQ